MKPRVHLPAGVVGLLTVAASAGMVLAGGVAAHAATPTPPWEPDAAAVGTITFYDSSGNVITTGAAGKAPFFAYAVGSATVRAGDVNGVVNAANPNPSTPTTSWFVDSLGGFSSYPLTTGPANIQTLSATHPVVIGKSTDLSLDDYRGEVTKYTGTGYTNMVQLRLRTSNAAGAQTTGYDDADVLVDPTTDKFTVVYPAAAAAVTATATTLTADPSPASAGQTVTLKATETPAVAGSVQFLDGATNIGAAVAVDGMGVASATTATLGQGSHNLSAVFTPTDTTADSGSTGTATEVVNPASTATTTALAVTQDGTAGDDAKLTATVTGPGATPNNAGSVSFFDNGSTTSLGTAPAPTAGMYTLDLPAGFAAGPHSVVAKFTPTDVTAFQASQSAPQTFTTAAAATTSACTTTGSTCTDPQNVSASVPGGTLVINTPYTAASPLSLGTLALNTAGTEFTGNAAFKNIVVTDTRTGTAGYTVTALATALTDGGSKAGSTINAQNLGLTALTATPGTGFTGTVTPTNNAAAEPAVAPAATGSVGLGGTTPHTVFAVDHGPGSVTVNGTLTLNAPTSTEAGLFTGTITFTVG